MMQHPRQSTSPNSSDDEPAPGPADQAAAGRPIAWHSLPAPDALARLGVGREGLTDAQARERLERFGPNRPRPPPSAGWLRRLARQFNNVLIWVLLVAAMVTAMLGDWKDTAIIVAVVVINAAIGLIQEGRAEQALAAIRDMLSPSATVLRGGRRVSIPAEEVVPGDIVFVQSGDKVPADLRLLEARGLQAQEAALTGESAAVGKSVEPAPADAPLAERSSLLFSGTLVTYGRGTGVAVATGGATEIGRIGAMLAEVQTLKTPLIHQIDRVGRWLTAVILAATAATFLFGVYVTGFPFEDMFLAAVGIAVAAIPEGLPAVVTVALAIGVRRMARRNAIIRRLPAVETLGSVTVICTDKTGTLTRNEMVAESLATSDHLFAVTGHGYAPEGAFLLDGSPVDPGTYPAVADALRAAALCTESSLRPTDQGWVVEGDPTEGALLAAAAKAGFQPERLDADHPRRDLIPFESENRFMATLHRRPDGSGVVYVKGAPERLLAMAVRQQGAQSPEPLDAAYWRDRVTEISARGQRTLAVAMREVPGHVGSLRLADLESDLTLIAVFGLSDPPRAEAMDAVAACRSAGIRVKMITGDHALTARAIGGRLGLANAERAATGADIDAADDKELVRLANEVDVFARAAPEHKLRLIRALQAQGEVAAMTGDGVNDAPALRRADIGVAMGQKGTETAKEAAEMVLADDNFASIEAAVEEGRGVRDNIVKTLAFMLPTNAGEAAIIVVAVFLGMTLPITPTQILWVNLITAVTLSVAIVFERPEPDIMARPPVGRSAPLLARWVLWRSFLVMLCMSGSAFFQFLWLTDAGAPIEQARTAAVTTLVGIETIYLFNMRRLHGAVLDPRLALGSPPVLIAAALVVLLQLAFIHVPPMQTLFGTAPLPPLAWAGVAGAMAVTFVLAELDKALYRRVRGG